MKKERERAAFQGELGAFSQQAIRQLLGDAAEPLPCQTFEQAFLRLQEPAVTAAVIPIENTLAGSVHENYDHLLRFDYQIQGETSVRINHNLIAAPGVPFSKIRRVISHPVALNQCLSFFAKHPHLEKAPFYDTAGSVKAIMEEGRREDAAIASALAAEIYGAHILKRSLEDDRRNFTRFFLLRRRGDKRGGAHGAAGAGWKTSLVFSMRNVPGALFRALAAFALRDVSLTKIESRPLRGKPWEYLFYVDLIGNVEDAPVRNAIRHLEESADFVRVLGCYGREPVRPA
jgi:prephenate dehydratase